MPKKKKGKKEGKKGAAANDATSDKSGENKPFEPPGASEKEISLRSEYVLYNAHRLSFYD